jgi:capsule polysaccharide modification protein KpsS
LADIAYFSGAAKSYFYRGSIEDWPNYLERLFAKVGIDVVVLFGDCRPYHRTAITCARRQGIDVFVFEEGYLRPDFVTFERDGVNGYSRLPREPQFYHDLDASPLPPPVMFRNNYTWGAIHSITYSVLATLFQWLSPSYTHHRDINCFRQSIVWLRGGIRRVVHTIRDRPIRTQLQAGILQPYFLVPLQVSSDSQITHSDFRDVSDFIELVIESFAHHASDATRLILKDHPLGRPYRDYSKFIEQLRNRFKLGQRLIYADVFNLPSALRQARGTVVINSTVGLSSVCHGTPTKCLGSAVYDIEGKLNTSA